MKVGDKRLTASTLVHLPLAFIRSGWTNIDADALWNVGNYGYSWSRTSRSATVAYGLNMNPTAVYPSGNYQRRGGFSLRRLYPKSKCTSSSFLPFTFLLQSVIIIINQYFIN